jgi:hypothetical protein
MRRLMAAAAQSLASLRLAHTPNLILALAALAVALLGPSSAHAGSVGADGLRISGSPPTSLQTGNLYWFHPTVSDPTHRAVTYFLLNQPSWLTVNRTTGLVSGRTTLVHNYYGLYIGATDGVDTVYLGSFRLIVKASSTSTDSVTITGSPASSVQAGQAYNFQPSAKDSSGKALSFSVQNKPSWATFSIATGGLSGTPAVSQAGTYSKVVISASDGTASAALPAFAITVTNSIVTPPPTISGSPTASVTAGQSYSFTPTAAGPSGDTLTFSITNKPGWASFNASTGQLSGTPSSSSVGSYSNIGISVSDGSQSASLPAFSIAVAAAQTATAGAPVVLYTDVASGPNSGGENNEGAYLSIFGKNFGTTGLGSTVKVYIGGVAVNNYRYLGPSRGRPDVQEISVQVGNLGSPTPGTALPIKVVVNGVASNTDQTFTVNPGRMLFVSQSGNDATAVPGDMTHPYRHVQNGNSGAFDVAQPGDTIVMLGTPLAAGAALTTDPTPAASAWTDVYNGYLLRFIDRNGTAATGASGTGPIALIAYPDEDVYIYESFASGATGAISGVDTHGYTGGRYVTVADLRIEAGGTGGGIDEQVAGQYWRVVNNEVTAATGSTDTDNLEGGIVGSGTGSFWVGNHVHDITSASPMEMHGIYIDGDGSYEVSYNWIEQITDGSGFQVYTDDGYSATSNNVSFHHNMVANVAKYGINIADGSGAGFVYYDNVVYGTGWGCLRFNTNTLKDAKIYNNTFYNCSSRAGYGVVNNDWNFPSNALDMENNILYANSGGSYSGGSVGMTSGIGTVTNNLFYNGSSGDGWDSHPVLGNPMFVSTTSPDLLLQTGSAAIGAGSTAVAPVVTTDYNLTPRSSASIDIGAYTH